MTEDKTKDIEDDDEELVDEDESKLTVPTKGKKALMPIELL